MIVFPEWGAGTGTFRLADEIARLQAVVAVQNEVSTTLGDLPALMTLVAARAEEMTGASGAIVETPHGDHLVCVAATGSGQAQLGRRLPIVGTLSGLALLTDDVLASDDTHADLRIDNAMVEFTGGRSLIAVPLTSAKKPFGVLQVFSPRSDSFGNEHVQMLRLLGGILSARVDLAAQLQARHELLAENAVTLTALRESETRFRKAFDHSGIGMALVAPDGRWLKVNPRLCQIVGFSPEELRASDVRSITHPEDLDADAEHVQSMLSGDIATYEMETRYVHKEGSTVCILFTASLVRSDDGVPLYFVAQIQDITARKADEEALRRLAIRDEMTGLFNRREMDRLLQEEIVRSQRYQRPLSFLLVDVDWFKRVNDTFGHQAGDRALQQVAKAVLGSIRALDGAARYGGEELAIILPETSGPGALVVAERIRKCVAERSFLVGDAGEVPPEIRLTVSVGVGTMSMSLSTSSERLIGDADRALYAAKHRGRNCCVLEIPGEGVPSPVWKPSLTASTRSTS